MDSIFVIHRNFEMIFVATQYMHIASTIDCREKFMNKLLPFFNLKYCNIFTFNCYYSDLTKKDCLSITESDAQLNMNR